MLCTSVWQNPNRFYFAGRIRIAAQKSRIQSDPYPTHLFPEIVKNKYILIQVQLSK